MNSSVQDKKKHSFPKPEILWLVTLQQKHYFLKCKQKKIKP